MNNKFKVVLLTTIMILGTILPLTSRKQAYASEKKSESANTLTVSFKKFSFTSNDYNDKEVFVEYSTDGDVEIATIKSKSNGQVLEVMKAVPNNNTIYSNKNTYPYTIIIEQKIGEISLQMSINVEMYSKGPYASINSIEGSHLNITNSVTPIIIESKNINVWAPNHKLPTTSLYYAYNGTLLAAVNKSDSIGISAKLHEWGFSLSHSEGHTIFFRRPFNKTGTINLY